MKYTKIIFVDDKLQQKGLKRNCIDKYYTKNSTVEMCMEAIERYLNIIDTDLIIEPSAGNGSFISVIKKITNNYLFYDIDPECDEIIEQDYLRLEYPNYKVIHVIGNPPFGRQSSLAIKFVKKSCEFCESLSFILPKSFKKDSMKRHIPLMFHMVFEMDLPKNSFLLNGREYDVPCVFQIWKRESYNRIIPVKLIPAKFSFVKKDESPDISFRRVGVNAGNISINIDKNTQSHYFIKFNNGRDLQDNIRSVSSVIFEEDNTVGPKSISKQEIIFRYNKII